MRFGLRNLLMTVAIMPAMIWSAWELDLIGGGLHQGEGYIVNGEPGWICWVHIGSVQVEGLGSPKGPTRVELIRYWETPHYHKVVFCSFDF